MKTMHTLSKPILAFLLLLCLVGAAPSSMADSSRSTGQSKGSVVQISAPPPIKPETLPVKGNQGGGSEYPIDNPANVKDYMQYELYNTFPQEVDLWNLEGLRLIRSLPVISPDRTLFVYSEIMFIPNNRQTYSKLYLVPVLPLPVPLQPHLPSEDAENPPKPPLPLSAYAARFDPNKTVKLRKSLVGVGYQKVKPFDFKTLSIVDWSASGDRLLAKERSGVLHVGLHTTDILVYDQGQGTVTIYPEVQRIIKNYWSKKGNLPHMEKLSWDIQPLGWEPGSDSYVLMKAWAYDKTEKKFLGLWRYDVDAEHTQLLNLEDIPIQVAANGWLATPMPSPSNPSGKEAWKENIKHPFKLRTPRGEKPPEEYPTPSLRP